MLGSMEESWVFGTTNLIRPSRTMNIDVTVSEQARSPTRFGSRITRSEHNP
jgi:hypothetical protein